VQVDPFVLNQVGAVLTGISFLASTIDDYLTTAAPSPLAPVLQVSTVIGPNALPSTSAVSPWNC